MRRRVARDPLLKVGIAAMVLAVGFAGVVAFFAALEGPRQAIAAKSPTESTSKELVRSDPGVEPWVEKDVTAPQTTGSPQPESGSGEAQDGSALPVDEDEYPLPTQGQIQAANDPRRYHLPPDAIMSLTIPALELRNAPILDSDTRGAVDRGVVHLPDTSLPWSNTLERNVYLAGHRLGWPGTGSHLVFYRLDELDGGERITLRDRRGNAYDYRVLESFTIWPDETWVTGRVIGRDLVTLQTCTPIPGFEKRLIVRAERV